MTDRKRREPANTNWNPLAGELCLDFANTASWHASAKPQETLGAFPDFVAWGRRVGLLNASRAERLMREAGKNPVAAAATLRRAIAIREVMYRIVVAVLQEKPPRASDLTSFNRELNSAFRHLRVVSGLRGCVWDWESPPGELEAMLWPILRSAADLLTSGRPQRIGQCADDRGCGWLFLDMTKNHSRRWCDMADCGNRAKARRHYQRRRGRASYGKPTRSHRAGAC